MLVPHARDRIWKWKGNNGKNIGFKQNILHASKNKTSYTNIASKNKNQIMSHKQIEAE